ncbi:Uncharacterised protein [Acinetobacter baumannii]|nr:Uncharacterised protein [Acinetobacter baumannii]
MPQVSVIGPNFEGRASLAARSGAMRQKFTPGLRWWKSWLGRSCMKENTRSGMSISSTPRLQRTNARAKARPCLSAG